MKAARLYGYKDVRVEEVMLDKLSSQEVMIEVEWCGLCGSDKHAYLSQIPIPSLPVTLGHEFSGTVKEVGEEVTNVKAGDRVVVNPLFVCGQCDNCRRGYPNLCKNIIPYGYHEKSGAFAEEAIVKDYMVTKIPDELPLDNAAIVEPTGIAIHALRISRFRAGDNAAVFGAGTIGLLLTSLLKNAGARNIIVVGHTESKRALATKLGATRVIDPDREDALQIINDITDGNGVDIAFDIAGAQQTFSLGIKALRARGEFVYVGLPQGDIKMNVFEAMIKEIQITMSYCTIDDFPIAVDFLAKDIMDVDGIITKKISLDDIVQEGFESLLHDKGQLKILVTPKPIA